MRTFHDTQPCAQSPIADMVSSYPIKTLNMMAHIRYATQGSISLENVHPFQREMWGIHWTFAHNGDVIKFSSPSASASTSSPTKNYVPQRQQQQQEDGTTAGCASAACDNLGTITQNSSMPMLGSCTEAIYHPVGDTDSEAVFCAMLNALRSEFKTLPTLPVLYEAIQRLCCEIVRGHERETILNFLLGCGQYNLFAFSWPGSRAGSTVWNGLHYLIRSPPFSTARLKDEDYSVNFNETNGPIDRVAIIATKPLTSNEKWKELKRGQLLMFDNGLPYSRPWECAGIERCGRGLYSRAIPRGEICPHRYQYNIPKLLFQSVCKAIGKDCAEVWAERAGRNASKFSLCCIQKMHLELFTHLAGVTVLYLYRSALIFFS